MIDIGLLRRDPIKVASLLKTRGVVFSANEFSRLDKKLRIIQQEVEKLRSEKNILSKQIASNKSKQLILKAKKIDVTLLKKEKELDYLLEESLKIEGSLPNIPFEGVTVGPDEASNKVVKEVGKKSEFDFEPKDHIELGEKLGIINVRKAAEVSGSRFGYFLSDAVLLEFALIRLAFDEAINQGFLPVVPPVMIKPDVFEGMGRLAASQKEERYSLPNDDLYLAGSGEHTMGPLHMNEIFNEKDLPKRYIGFSTCFRREAGSYGKDVKGMLRVHKFDKVEMFVFSKPEFSEVEHQKLVALQERLMQKLELPYRVVEICTGDMGWTDAKAFDIETWLPFQQKYRETHSASNTSDFQSRGINVKYKRGDGKKEFVHMLNATAFAIGRTIITILENYQQKDGSVKVPEVLQDYVGKKVIS